MRLKQLSWFLGLNPPGKHRRVRPERLSGYPMWPRDFGAGNVFALSDLRFMGLATGLNSTDTSSERRRSMTLASFSVCWRRFDLVSVVHGPGPLASAAEATSSK
mmetsp:Transcript_27904/g.64872  ORF Transcript_27904/g.64872 Transcript_27904/m.64872 type:complete len:104 (-) Transcript_27904:1524-1835(-)